MISPAYVHTMALYNSEMNRRNLRRRRDAQRRTAACEIAVCSGRSLHGTLSHLMWGDRRWMSRLDGSAGQHRRPKRKRRHVPGFQRHACRTAQGRWQDRGPGQPVRIFSWSFPPRKTPRADDASIPVDLDHGRRGPKTSSKRARHRHSVSADPRLHYRQGRERRPRQPAGSVEAVHGTAIGMQLPVDRGPAHLRLEGSNFCRRHQGIRRAMAD